MTKFRVTDSSLNNYGFRVLTSGLDWSLFDKNPIMLWMHSRAWSNDDNLPPGKWQNREVSGDLVTMEPVFDEKDAFAMKLKNKVDQGIINMASIGVDIIETSVDPLLMLPGQTRETVTKALVKEVSLVDMGGNFNAIRLFKDGVEVKLADGEDNEIIPLIKNQDMKSIALKLGLAENATEDQILQKIGELNSRVATLTDSNTQLAATIKQVNDEKCAALVDEAVSQKKITADKKDAFLKLAASDFENCKAVLAALNPVEKPTDFINKGGSGANGSGAENLSGWKQLVAKGSDAVLKMKSEDPDTYSRLYKEEYGANPDLK